MLSLILSLLLLFIAVTLIFEFEVYELTEINKTNAIISATTVKLSINMIWNMQLS